MPSNNIIKDFEILFTPRTGVTLIIPENDKLNSYASKEGVPFFIKKETLFLGSKSDNISITSMKKDHMDEIIEWKSFMIYETKNSEVIRCTPSFPL